MNTPSQFDLSEKLVTLIHYDLGGFHPGFRAVHAKGRFYMGTFVAAPEAKQLTRAAHMQGQSVPVSVRLSFGSGDPTAPPQPITAMAVKFYLPNGTNTDLIGISFPAFFASTPEELAEMLSAARPDPDVDPATGQKNTQINEEGLKKFMETYPKSAAAAKLAKSLPPAISLAQSRFFPIHAFRFVNAAGGVQYGRYRIEPTAGYATTTVEELINMGFNHLYEELEERLRHAPVTFDLLLQLAEENDPTDDPTLLWPDTRKMVTLGQLELTKPTTNEQLGNAVMLHDPTRLTDGIEPSADPILAARRGAYEVSVAQRTGGWKGCPFHIGTENQ